MGRSKKPVTLQAKLGFQDDDLKTETHDNIMILLDFFIKDLLKENMRWCWNDKICDWMNYIDEVRRAVELYNIKIINSFDIQEEYEIEIKQKVWEKPIVNNGNCIGFTDLFVEFSSPHIVLCYEIDGEKIYFEVGDFYKVKEMKVNLEVIKTISKHYYEVKTTIQSLGDLIRQINFYKEYDSNASYIVVSPIIRPDKRDLFLSILKEQNIHYINSDILYMLKEKLAYSLENGEEK